MMKVPTIKQLRQSGWKVRVMHTREHDQRPTISGWRQTLSNFGGYTRIEVTEPDSTSSTGLGKSWVGEARCSEKDNYNRRLGNSIALGRAWEQYLHEVENQERCGQGSCNCHG